MVQSELSLCCSLYSAKYGYVSVGKILLADKRAINYTIEQLVSAYRIAVVGGHELFCDLLIDTLTPQQRDHVKDLLIQLKGDSLQDG